MAIRTTKGGDDHRLVDAWRRGDTAAMGLLYERYAPALRAYCTHRLGPGDADDAVHDTFLKAQAALVGFEEGARVWPWLVTIAANVCSDVVRRRLRFVALHSRPDSGVEFDEVVAARVRAAIVGDALRQVAPRYRAPLYLRHFVGATYEEIARMQGRSVSSVRSLIMRSRRRLGQQIEETARAERQWPLPTAVPAIGRIPQRVRALRTRRHRLGHPAPQWLAFQLGWFASAVVGMQGAAAAVGAVTLAGATVPEAVGGYGHGADQAGPLGASGPVAAQVWLPDIDVATTTDTSSSDVDHRLARVAADAAPLPGGPWVSATVGVRVQRQGNDFNVRHEIVVSVPGRRENLSGGTYMPCWDPAASPAWRQTCDAVVQAAGAMP